MCREMLITGDNELSIDGPQPSAMDVLGEPYDWSELIDRVQSALRLKVRTSFGSQASRFGHAQA